METLTSIIGESYKSWDSRKPILISTPTGSGKTTFVLKTLLPYAAQNGHSICYMSNRQILKQQVENRIDSFYYDNIFVMNYQSPDISDCLTQADYWVFDEAHFFLSDAPFNKNIGELIGTIKQKYKYHICIFMTATPQYLYLILRYLFDDPIESYKNPLPKLPEPYYLRDDKKHSAAIDDFKTVKQLLTYKEFPRSSIDWYKQYEKFEEALKRFQRKHKYTFAETVKEYYKAFEAIKGRCILYHISHDYSYIIPCYFRDYSDLTDMIQHTPEAEKWIIFIPSKRLGQEIKDELLTAGILDVAYLDAQGGNRNGETARKSIIDTENFPYRILICTKVLDNGANISDPAVKHIVILKADETTFLQMLGRRRIDYSTHETINLYIKHETNGSMQKFVDQKYLNILHFLYWFLLMKAEHHTRYSNEYGERYRYPSTSGIIGKKYAEGGQFKYPYRNYVEQVSDIQEPLRRLANNVTHSRENTDRLVVEAYKIYIIAKQQIIYEYYKMMAVFEAYQNKVADSDGIVEDTMWIEEQLRWLGLTYDPQRWNTVVFGMEQDARKQLEDFLNEHQGILQEEYKTQLKEFVLKYLSTLRPEPKEARSKASFSTVQTILKRYNFPYILSKQRCSRNGEEHIWWIITSLIPDDDKGDK